MAARAWIPLVVAVIVAGVCVRLGAWQLDRLAQRKARNATIEAAFREAPIPAERAMDDSVRRFRRVIARGRWGYTREAAIVGRTRAGAPGVHIVTPMALQDGSNEILVNRGWVYSPDARTVDLARWHEGDVGEVIGYVDEPPPSLRAAEAPLYVVALADSSTVPASDVARPARLSPPPFGENGPHLGYAVQWFSFAAIALIGAPILVRRQRRRRE
jgi:surfeit locus 1 family protein